MAERPVSTHAQRGSGSPESRGMKKQTTGIGGSKPGLSTAGDWSQDQEQSKPLEASHKPPIKRKRGEQSRCSPTLAQDSPPSKRPQTAARESAKGRPQEAERSQEAKKNTGTAVADPVQSWVLNERWPPELFEPDDHTRAEPSEHDSWLEAMMALPPPPVVQYVEINGFRIPLPVKKTPTSIRRKQSDSSLNESSERGKRETQSTQYRDPRYPTMLENKGSFLRDFSYKTPQATAEVCHQLLIREQVVPQDSLFHDDLFDKLCEKIQDRNEAIIVQDISRLIVPSAMNLAIYGDTHLDSLIESVNEAWMNSIAVEGPRPQPDYAVGFNRSAFTIEQLEKLDPLVGSVFDTSFFAATYRMYFPFLTCEVKCSATALDIADRQNAHSMTIAVRGVVELYRAVNRQQELDREILAFSISHDHRSVRIYGHYPVINRDKVTFYRHQIRDFSFVEMAGREKWTAYKFTKNIYDIWMPTHLRRICSAIEQLPSVDFQVPEQPEVQSEGTGLSQDMGSLLSDPSQTALASQIDQGDNQLNPILPPTVTPNTSVSNDVGQEVTRKAKKPRSTR